MVLITKIVNLALLHPCRTVKCCVVDYIGRKNLHGSPHLSQNERYSSERCRTTRRRAPNSCNLRPEALITSRGHCLTFANRSESRLRNYVTYRVIQSADDGYVIRKYKNTNTKHEHKRKARKLNFRCI